ncbi:MAG: hypothetical protein WC027_00825 [Candidatus Paceibacterota bacterium]
MKMSKKSAIILILTVFLGALAALIWFYFAGVGLPTKAPIKQISTGEVYDPFGTISTSSSVASSTEEIVPVEGQNNFIVENRLRKISDDPISGYAVNENLIHYILRANGNIYETSKDSLEIKRLSITTIPKVYESVWLPGGEKLIIRYLKDNTENIETFSVKINPATTTLNEFEGGIDGNFLPEGISTVVINPAGDKIFYLTNNLNGASGFVSKPDGLNKSLLFESPLIEWAVSWPKEETITMSTKPTAKIPGYLYFLNTKTGDFSKILGGITGLTTKINKTASEVLYSDSVRNTPRLYLFNIKNNESKLLPWSTFPEKCLWSNVDATTVYCAVPKSFSTGEYPDLWYQGLTSFTDDIWRINTNTGASTLVFDIQKETKNNLDIVDLNLDQNDDYLFFTNKTDLTLWSLKLK